MSSLFLSSKVRGEERKTSKRPKLSERDCRRDVRAAMPRAALVTPQSRFDAYLFCVLPHGFSRKERDRSQSIVVVVLLKFLWKVLSEEEKAENDQGRVMI